MKDFQISPKEIQAGIEGNPNFTEENPSFTE